MRRFVISALCAGLVVMAMPVAMGKGPAGLLIEGPGISGELEILGDGTTPSADEVNAWISGTGFAELAYGASTKSITPSAETPVLGPEYRITWIHMGPEGDFEIPALMYPLAEGGPLVYMQPDTYFEDIDMTVRGGWYHSSADLVALLEEYGVEVAPETEAPVLKAEAEPVVPEPAVVPAGASTEPADRGSAVWLVIAALGIAVILLGLWATGRRPRRLRAS